MNLNFTLPYIESTSKSLLETYPFLKSHEDVIKPSGKEHYFFLTSLSNQLNNANIIELGTHTGRSSLALGFNKTNKLTTYDIVDILLPDVKNANNANITFKIDNLFDPVIREQNRNKLLSSDVLFIDIDPHEGVMEYEMYQWLKDNDYQGLIFFDDIHLKEGHMGVQTGNSMQKTLWDKIEDKYKKDLTHVGHWSGTGLVSFNFDKYNIII